jgi:hypothetical protein
VATASIHQRPFEQRLRRAGVVAVAARVDLKRSYVVIVDDKLNSWEARAAARIASVRLDQGRDTDLVLRADLPPPPRLVEDPRPITIPLVRRTITHP